MHLGNALAPSRLPVARRCCLACALLLGCIGLLHLNLRAISFQSDAWLRRSDFAVLNTHAGNHELENRLRRVEDQLLQLGQKVDQILSQSQVVHRNVTQVLPRSTELRTSTVSPLPEFLESTPRLHQSVLSSPRRAACDFGRLPGHWEVDGQEFYVWQPHVKSNSTCHFEQYLHQSHVQPNFESRFRNKSIFVIGDSLDRNAVVEFCCRYPDRFDIDCPIPWRTGENGLTFIYCEVRGLTVGFFFNIGILPAPFFIHAYAHGKLCCNFSEDLRERISNQAASAFKEVVLQGKDPTMVMLQSHLWDAVNPRWKKDDDGQLAFWFLRAKTFVSAVREAFPTSRFIWRSAGAVINGGFDNVTLREMDVLIQGAAHEMDVEFINYQQILISEHPEKDFLYKDIHPLHSGRLALINVALNILSNFPTD